MWGKVIIHSHPFLWVCGQGHPEWEYLVLVVSWNLLSVNMISLPYSFISASKHQLYHMVPFQIVIYKCNNTSLLLSACCMTDSRCPGWQNTANSTLQANLPEFFGFDWNFLCLLAKKFCFSWSPPQTFSLTELTIAFRSGRKGEMFACRWVKLKQLEVHQGNQWKFASDMRQGQFYFSHYYHITSTLKSSR